MLDVDERWTFNFTTFGPVVDMSMTFQFKSQTCSQTIFKFKLERTIKIQPKDEYDLSQGVLSSCQMQHIDTKVCYLDNTEMYEF